MLGTQSLRLILILCVILFLTGNSCWLFKPEVEVPVYDVLKPGAEVDIVGYTIAGQKMIGKDKEIVDTKDGDVIVTGEYMVWTKLLFQEVERLRDKVGEDW